MDEVGNRPQAINSQTEGSQELPAGKFNTRLIVGPDTCQFECQMEESSQDPPPSDSSTQLRPDLDDQSRGSPELSLSDSRTQQELSSSDSHTQLSNSQKLSSSDSQTQLKLQKNGNPKTRGRIENIAIAAVIVTLWGLFMLPVVLYYLPDSQVCMWYYYS